MVYGFQLQLDEDSGDLVLSGLKQPPKVLDEEKVKQDLHILFRVVEGEASKKDSSFGEDLLT